MYLLYFIEINHSDCFYCVKSTFSVLRLRKTIADIHYSPGKSLSNYSIHDHLRH